MRNAVNRVLWIAAAVVLAACAGGPLASSARADGCPNEKLRAEQPYGLELPDCRAYEMVSPADKTDNNVSSASALAAVSGEAFSFLSRGAFSDAQSAFIEDRYLARRGPQGWSTHSIDPPYKVAYETNPAAPYNELVFTPELTAGLLLSRYNALSADSPVGYVNLYVANTGDGSYQAVTTVPPAEPPYGFLPIEPEVAGASTDLSHVVFQETANLTPDATGANPLRHHIYEGVAGRLSLVDVAPEGATLAAQDTVGSPSPFDQSGDAWHAVSSDGSRVVFTAGEGEGEHRLGQIYIRELDSERTIEVSRSQRTSPDPNGPKPARYWGANADGTKVFFTSRSELTDDANTGGADDAENLYEYDVEDGVLHDLTVDDRPSDAEGAAVLGMVTASEDGSYVYFVAEGNLAGAAVADQPNLYLYHEGNVSFIATLARSDERDWEGEGSGEEGDGHGGPGSHTVRVTSDGTRLAFESARSLTGYDNQPAEPGDCEDAHCREVYLFEATTGKLACVSCNPSGGRPVGPSGLGDSESEELPGEETGFGIGSPFYAPRSFSEGGRRLFFQSQDALVPSDSNGRQDVYEYEGGAPHLISDGAGAYNSTFLDASASGDDVFIATTDQLLPATDQDQRVDVYDARIGGGYPVSPAAPACDNGDACKPPVSPQPTTFGAPASATFSGAGNLAPQPSIGPAVKAAPKAKVDKRHKKRKRHRVKHRGHSRKARRSSIDRTHSAERSGR